MLFYAGRDLNEGPIAALLLFESKKSNVSVRTLIVEDNLTVRNVIKERLEGVGCEVVAEAGNAFEGLNLFRSLQPDLVTLDLLMPQVSGIDAKILFRSIREESPDAAVIIISARPKAVERAAYLAEVQSLTSREAVHRRAYADHNVEAVFSSSRHGCPEKLHAPFLAKRLPVVPSFTS
jgi:CheY-like chemotaxis protein